MNYMPFISAGVKKCSFIPTVKGKLLGLFKDGRLCSVLFKQLKGSFENSFLSTKEFYLVFWIDSAKRIQVYSLVCIYRRHRFHPKCDHHAITI